MAPVYLVIPLQCGDSVFNGALYQLHLFDLILDQTFLEFQGTEKKMVICVADRCV